MIAGWRRWLRIWRRDEQTDIDAELRFHLEARIEDLIARGTLADAARVQALEEFGDVDVARIRLGEIDRRIAEQHRRAEWWEGIAQDLRHTMRGLARSPGFTVMVVVTLALGIGANAAIFSVINRMYLQNPPGVVRPGEVRRVEVRSPRGRTGQIDSRAVLSYPEFRDLTQSAPGFDLAAYVMNPEHFGRGEEAPTVNVTAVAGAYFGVLGVRITHGRGFATDEVGMGVRAPVAVISDAMWRVGFGGASDIIGRHLSLGVHEFTIIGVAPRGFRGVALGASDLWVPLNTYGSWTSKASELFGLHSAFLWPVVRLTTPAQASQLTSSATLAFRRSPMVRDSTTTAELLSITDGLTAFNPKEAAIATRLAGVAAIILLLACANVANLMLTRGMKRRREIAIRLALGVSRQRLLTQLIAESMIVGVIAGAAALLVAVWGATALRHVLFPDVRWGAAAVDGRVAGFTAVVALVAGLAAGLVPALQTSNPDLIGSLKGGVASGDPGRSRTRSALLIAQAAVSVLLLAGAGLFVKSLQSVKGIDIGYDTGRMIVASASYDVDAAPATGTSRGVKLAEVAERIGHLPGVESVGLALNGPMEAISFTFVFLPDRDSTPQLGGLPPVTQTVSPGFFAASGIRVLAGRGFRDDDRIGSEPVVVVSQSMAKIFWPNESALGKCIILDQRTSPCRLVVGVVSDEHVVDIVEQTAMQFFTPLAQSPYAGKAGQIVILAAEGQTSRVVAETQRAIVATFGPPAIPRVRVMADILAPQLRPWRLGAALFSAAGLLALLVAAVGIYSAVAYGVSQRTREIGIRLALGARGGDVATLIVAQGVRTVVVGVAIGIASALVLGRFVASLLYGVTPRDPVVIGTVAAVLVVVAIVACLVPAWRAARVDPMETLRAE